MLAKTKSEKTKGIIALIIVSFIFASMGIFAKFLSSDFTILQQVYLRVFIAFIIGSIVFSKDLHVTNFIKLSTRDWGILVFRAIALYLLGVTLFSYAYTIGKYSNVTFVQDLPFTALLGFIFLKEKITKKKILYLLIGFVGVVFISVKDYSNLFSWGFAEVLSILSGFFFSVSYIARRWQSNVINNKEISVLIFFIAFLLLITTSILLGEGVPHVSWNTPLLLALVGAGVFNVANLFLTNYGFEKIEAVIASNIISLELFFAILLGFFFYQEIPNIKEVLGGLLIVWSVYQMNKLA